MMEIPDIGSVLCATILAEVGDIKRFSSFNKFYAYTGLEPRRFETGDSVSRDKVSHEGSRHLRKVFYKNLQVITHNNPEWYNYYKRKRETKETCVAYGHLIKKVLKAIHFFTKNDVAYDPLKDNGVKLLVKFLFQSKNTAVEDLFFILGNTQKPTSPTICSIFS